MPFYPGDPNINRKGRPKKGKTLTDILMKHLRKRDVEDLDTGKIISRKDAMAKELIRLAIEEKNIIAIKYIFDRIDGFPKQSINTSIETGEIIIKHHKEEEKD